MKQFAASGSCFSHEMIIKGKVNGITFISNEFTGTMNSNKFWDDLRAFAKSKNALIKLMY